MEEKTITLEPSSNTHTMTNVTKMEELGNSILKVKVGKKSKVLHGEHGTIGIESENVIKYVQQELNPVTRMLQNAWD
jgi:hypothetical protein